MVPEFGGKIRRMEANHPAGERLRAAERFDAGQPIEIAGRLGWVRDLSATGMYFYCDSPHTVGTSVQLAIEIAMGGQKQRLECEGEVVRADDHEGGFGIAVRLECPLFSNVEVADSSVLLQRRKRRTPDAAVAA